MAKHMIMPKIGVNMVDATIIEWYVTECDIIREGDMILSAETDKAVQEIPASMSGKVGKILAEPGQLVPCQEPIVIILEPGENLSDSDSQKKFSEEKKETGESEAIMKKKVMKTADGTARGTVGLNNRIRISPLARKLARKNNLRLESLKPEQPGFRIVKNDILENIRDTTVREAVLKSPVLNQTTGKSSLIPVSGTRKVIAERLSLHTGSTVTAVLFIKVDAGALIDKRIELKKPAFL